MKEKLTLSDEQLNAFIDAELGESEQIEIFSAVARDPELEKKLCRLRQLKEMLKISYAQPPTPVFPMSWPFMRPARHHLALAGLALLTLVVGFVLGFNFKPPQAPQTQAEILHASRLPQTALIREKILFHIDSIEDERIQQNFAMLENILNANKDSAHHLHLEVVANSEGLNVVRANSPYADKIQQLSLKYRNLSFLACSVAMENTARKEGKPVQLLPDVYQIDAAMAQIARRLQQGWTYVKG